MIGSNVKIKTEEDMRIVKPDYLFVLPYSFINRFLKWETDLIKTGTKFIIPLPKVKILPDKG